MRPTVLHGSRDRFAEERSASNVGQEKDRGDRKDAARRESHVPGDNEQRKTKVSVVTFRTFDGDVGGQYATDQKECVDGEQSIQKTT